MIYAITVRLEIATFPKEREKCEKSIVDNEALAYSSYHAKSRRLADLCMTVRLRNDGR